MFQTGHKPLPQPYKVEGIGQDEMPGNVDFSVIDEIHAVTDKDSFLRTRQLARIGRHLCWWFSWSCASRGAENL